MKKEKNNDWIYYVFVFLSAIAVFTYILHVGFISSGSMEPALMTHDVTVSSRIIISPIKCGDIILLHDIYDSSVAAALEIVDELKAKGFIFVTVDQLLLD